MSISTKRRHKLISTGFILPCVILVISLIIYPIIQTIIYSFQNIRFFGVAAQDIHFSLSQYSKIIHSSSFWYSLSITAIYTLASVLIAFIIGLVTALLLNTKFKGNRIARIVFLLPWAIPGVAVSLMFVWMFDPSFGIINYILRSLNIISTNLMWLSSSKTVLAVVIAATVWKGYPFFTLMLYAGLQGIPRELYEAASVDGATRIDEFKHITLPGLRSVIAISIILHILWAFRTFEIIYVMTRGGPYRSTETLPVKIFQEAFQYFNISYASAIGVVSLIICIIIIVFSSPILKKEFY